MTSFLDKLNLRPMERRLVVIAALVVLGFLYFFFIWPQFSEWKKLNTQKANLDNDLLRYQREIDRKAEYQAELRKLKEKGVPVDSEEQALNMQRTVGNLATMNGVYMPSYTPGKGPVSSGGKTNAFFEESTANIQFSAEETNLVNFVYALSSGNSLIRVSSMTLNPDPTRMKLMGSMTLVASYPKRAAAKPATPATPARPGLKVPTVGGPKPPGSLPPQSISGALSAASKPGVTNAPATASWWTKVKGFFTPSKTTNAPASTNAPTRTSAPTNAPPAKRK